MGLFLDGRKELGAKTRNELYDGMKEWSDILAIEIILWGASNPRFWENVYNKLFPQGKIGITTIKDWENRTSDLVEQVPIEIPSNATVKVQAKDGYGQISFKWKEDGLKYEVRWHNKTPGAPSDVYGNSWVVSRITPGTATGQIRKVHILVGDTWIPNYQWQAAIQAYKNGTATQEQLQLLRQGHWPAP